MINLETLPINVGVARFISPEYSRKYVKTVPRTDCDRPDTLVYEDAPKEDRIIDWLKNNTLFKLREPFPEHFHSDWGYFLQGRNGAACIVNPTYHTLTPQTIHGHPDPLIYQWRITIKMQPSNVLVPLELRSALEEMNYSKVENFKDK